MDILPRAGRSPPAKQKFHETWDPRMMVDCGYIKPSRPLCQLISNGPDSIQRIETSSCHWGIEMEEMGRSKV